MHHQLHQLFALVAVEKNTGGNGMELLTPIGQFWTGARAREAQGQEYCDDRAMTVANEKINITLMMTMYNVRVHWHPRRAA